MRIFYDTDTQVDFMSENGALYVPGAEEIRLSLKKLTQYARNNNIPIIGSVDRHFGTEKYKEKELELQRWGGLFPDHCMDDTAGFEKISETSISPLYFDVHGSSHRTDDLYIPCLREENISFSKYMMRYESIISPDKIDSFYQNFTTEKRISWWHSILSGINLENITSALNELKQEKSKGIYFEKQSYDIFSNSHLDIFLHEAKVSEAIVYGVATDYCVKAVVLGMQKREIQTYVVEDAIQGITEESSVAAIEEMKLSGAKIVSLEQVLGGKF
ncbi:isochorismatase family protein [archaeon]|jgi:nicotinamidase-related amidase|nr:isochorismatase family protein [archaeon]MBT3451328.1 isochorismatase family protein [archaeon]MBT6869356.1 isochorismatase family protein [archaeon]MBT7192519.1 isochorismatase family protein [archaeon]MBT7380595.1 isochorismatase family protein [archaeon]